MSVSGEVSLTEDQQSSGGNSLRPLRASIPIVLLCLMVAGRYVPQLWQDGPSMTWAFASFGPTLAGLALLLIWWPFLSRASRRERLLGFLGAIVSIVLASMLLHETMRGLIPVITLPIALAGFGVGMVLTSGWLTEKRTLLGVLCCLLAGGSTALLRNEGAWGSFAFDLHWRFSPTPEEQFLQEMARRDAGSVAVISDVDTEALAKPAQWPGFRGAGRLGVQQGVKFSADWQANPPQEKWRTKVGPGWSSFAVSGNFLYTQEQRGENEAVVCYSADSGQQVWARSVESRFFEALGGLGPRATPTLHQGAVYSLGAEGLLLRLDAVTGDLQWQVDLRKEANRAPPMWGFSSSPLVFADTVVVYAGGKDDQGVLAFDLESGKLRWNAPAGPMSYGSLQVIAPLGRELIGLLSDVGLQTYDPTAGKADFNYEWKHTGYRALQPLFLDDSRLLIPTGMGAGTRLVKLTESGGTIEGEQLWTSRRLKPDYSDVLVHKGNVYGFDNSVFASIKIEDGSLNWKGGRYGKGQALLLADSDLILVITEEGELVLVEANPDKHVELGRVQALDGRTWNHPVVVGTKLFVRNAAEAVCYELTPAAETP